MYVSLAFTVILPVISKPLKPIIYKNILYIDYLGNNSHGQSTKNTA